MTEKQHPPGTIAFPCSDLGRYNQFTYSLSTVEMPEGTALSMIRGASIVVQTNEIIRSEFRGEWIWFLGDDHVFPSDILMRLLEHEVDVVVPLCFRRTPPFQLVLFKEENEVEGRPHYTTIHPEELPAEGLMEVYAAGTAGMLVRRRVLEAIGDPWFENSHGDVQNEDVEFCRKVRAAGFAIHADPRAFLGHIGVFEIWPADRDGQKCFRLHFGPNDEVFGFPPRPAPAIVKPELVLP